MTKEQSPLEQRVLDFIYAHELVPAPQTLVVAVSGGADSLCLLYTLLNIKDELGVDLHIAHLDHRLRGADSAADARYVERLARRLGIPATVESRDVKRHQKESRLSLEEAAREVRYGFLAEVAAEVGAERVAVGHTQDDNVETILMHLVRGSGTRGMRGLLPLNRWQLDSKSLTVIRPLLVASREETQDYCRQHHLKPRLDVSNLSLSPLRNRIRQKLLPLLQGYNPKVKDALVRASRIANDDIDFFDGETARLWTSLVEEQKGTIIIRKEELIALPAALQRHLLRRAVEKLLGNLKDIEAHHIEDMIGALEKPAGKFITLPGGLLFSVDYDRYLLGCDAAALSPFPVLHSEYAMAVPGITKIPGWRFEAVIVEREQMRNCAELTACVDYEKTGNKLIVRPRQPGDRFQPLGMNQPKKLGEFMIDARIPQSWRSRIPVVSSPAQIIWVAGCRIDERVKVTDGTKKILRLCAERLDEQY